MSILKLADYSSLMSAGEDYVAMGKWQRAADCFEACRQYLLRAEFWNKHEISRLDSLIRLCRSMDE